MKVVTCFSYKGGAGRTVACANIAAAMASRKDGEGCIKKALNRKTAVLDLDVFAPGTHRVFDISNGELRREAQNGRKYLQDYLLVDMRTGDFLENHAVTLDDALMQDFRLTHAAGGNCRNDFTLFPSRPDPSKSFTVQKLHENLLWELLQHLEEQGYEYVFIDSESGSRSMAAIACCLADVILMLFRIGWQHVEGTLAAAEHMLEGGKAKERKSFFLLPACVPLVGTPDSPYRIGAPGAPELQGSIDLVYNDSGLTEFIRESTSPREGGGEEAGGARGPGYLMSEKLCIHESLFLAGYEQVVVYGADFANDRAGQDYYSIAEKLDSMLTG